MLLTLQKYLFREMGRTFFLTTIGLTGILSTCGGVYAIAPLESVTTRQTVMLMVLVVPMCAAFTLPFAALFSATITYGRLAADNEFTACRSSGINTYVLFLPCLAISLVSAAITFVFFNFVIPGFMGQINQLTRASIKAVISQSLLSGRSVEFNNRSIYADEAVSVGPPNRDAIWLKGVAFLEFDDEQIVTLGTSESAMVKFDFSGEYPQIQADLVSIRLFEQKRGTIPNLQHETLGPFEFQRSSKLRPKHLSLTRLLDYMNRPEKVFQKVRNQLHNTRRAILAKLIFDYVNDHVVNRREECILRMADHIVRLQAEDCELRRDADKNAFWIYLSNVRLVEGSKPDKATYQANKARMELVFEPEQKPVLLIKMIEQVRLQDAQEPREDLSLKARTIDPLAPPAAVLKDFNSQKFANQQLWNLKVDLGLGPQIDYLREKLHKVRTKYLHEIHSEIHVRTVYSISVIVLAALGAALGIIFRGGQLLVAFGISFIPTLFVVVMTILGKQIAKEAGTLELGLAIMWGGLVIGACLDFVVFKKYLPR